MKALISALTLSLVASIFLTSCGDPAQRARRDLSRMGYILHIEDYLRAAGDGNEEAVRLFRVSGMGFDTPNTHGDTPLIRAAAGGHLEIVEDLVSMGAELNRQGQYERTALLHAAERGHGDVVHYLLTNGADASLPDAKKWVPLTAAAYKGHPDVVAMLVPHGSEQIDDAIIIAAVGGDPQVLRVLTDAGAKVDNRNANGHTPLMLASHHGHGNAVNVLLQNGANRFAQDDFGHTAADLAEKKGHSGLAKLLRARDSNPKTAEIAQKTATPKQTKPLSQPKAVNVAAAKPKTEPEPTPASAPKPAPKLTRIPLQSAPAQDPLIRAPSNLMPTSAASAGQGNSTPPAYDPDTGWSSIQGQIVEVEPELTDDYLSEYFEFRSFSDQTLPVGLVSAQTGRAQIRTLYGDTRPRFVGVGDWIADTGLQVVSINPRQAHSKQGLGQTVDVSEVVVRDSKTSEMYTLVSGVEARADSFATIGMDGNNRQFDVRQGDLFQIRRRGSAAQNYRVMQIQPNQVTLQNLATNQTIQIRQRGPADRL